MRIPHYLKITLCAIILTLTACGKFDRLDNGGFTNVTFTRAHSDRLSTTATLTNGIIIYAYSSSFATNLKINDETGTANIQLPNGTYTFFAFGYGYNIDSTGVDLRCAVSGGDGSSVSLTGGAASIPLNFMQSNCNHVAFSSGGGALETFTNTVPNSGPFFKALEVAHCGSGVGTGLSTIAGSTNCSPGWSTGSTVSKYQIVIPIFVKSGPQFTKIGEAYRSACSNTFPSSAGSPDSASIAVRFPIGNASQSTFFPIEFESFSDASCTSTPLARFRFNKGLINGPDPEAIELAKAVTNSNRVRVFLRQP